jgi:hypothetical protein
VSEVNYREPSDDLFIELKRLAEVSGTKVVMPDWPAPHTSHPSLRNSVWAKPNETPPFTPAVAHCSRGV